MTEARQALQSVVLIAPVSARKSSVAVDVSRDQSWKVATLSFQQRVFAIGSIVGIAVVLLVLFNLTGVMEPHSGVVVVEINDPEGLVQVTVVGEDAVVTEMDGEPIKLKAGEHKLHVKRGELDFDTETFTLNQGGRVVLAVKVVRGQVQVVRDQTTPIGKRDIPKWAGEDYAMAFDGESSYVEIPSLKNLPEGPITIEAFVELDRFKDASLILVPGKNPHNVGY